MGCGWGGVGWRRRLLFFFFFFSFPFFTPLFSILSTADEPAARARHSMPDCPSPRRGRRLLKVCVFHPTVSFTML